MRAVLALFVALWASTAIAQTTTQSGAPQVGGSSPLPSADIWVGNASNIATAVAPSGDLTMSNAGAFTIGANKVTLPDIAQIGTNTVLGNTTSGTANVTALSVGSCNGAADALIWTTNTGFGCNTAIAASTVTTNANLTGPITSVGNATSLASQTGTGTKFVVDTSPTLITPALGVATATSLAIGGATIGTNGLAVTGTLSASGQYFAPDGTLTVPSYSFTNATDTGVYLNSAAAHSIRVTAGSAGTTSNGGSVSLQAGPGGATSGDGGATNITGGAPTDGNGGNINVNGRNAATSTSTSRDGGTVVLQAGAGVINGVGGNVTATGGAAVGTGSAGLVVLTGGASTGGASGTGGSVNLSGGTSNGGFGGGISLRPGAASGGTNGTVRLLDSASTAQITIDIGKATFGGSIFSGASQGVTCPTGSPSASFATVNGIVTHC